MNHKTDRIQYFDYLRIFAVFSVVLLHVLAGHLWDDIGKPSFLVFDFYNAATRWCVPVFVMISGALFLDPDREIQIGRLYKKNLLRLITAFAFWSAVYALIDFFEGVRLRDVVFNMIRGHYHLWYLFMLAGLYLAVPVLRKVTASKKLTEYFITLWFVLVICLQSVVYLAGFLGTSYSELFSKVSDSLCFQVAGGYSGYFVIGYYLNRYELSKKRRIILCALGLCAYILTVLLPVFYYAVKGLPNNRFNEYLTVNVCIMSVCVFVIFKHNKIVNRNGKTPAVVKTVSDCAFGIYLVHLIILEFAENHLGIDSMSFCPAAAIPLLSVAVFIISFMIVFVLRKIPVLNKYIV